MRESELLPDADPPAFDRTIKEDYKVDRFWLLAGHLDFTSE